MADAPPPWDSTKWGRIAELRAQQDLMHTWEILSPSSSLPVRVTLETSLLPTAKGASRIAAALVMSAHRILQSHSNPAHVTELLHTIACGLNKDSTNV